MSLFPYSGNKTRFLKYYRPPPRGVSTIVEPFGGSMAYSLKYARGGIGAVVAESDRRLWRFWENMRAVNGWRLGMELDSLAEKLSVQPQGFDVRELNPSDTALFVLQLTCCGMYRGAAISYCYYPQFLGSLRKAAKAINAELQWCNRDQIRLAAPHYDFSETEVYDRLGTVMYFIDPPYLRTIGGYSGKTTGKPLEPGSVRDFISRLESPCIVTYGDGAEEDLPGLPWTKIATRTLSKVRSGGTITRGEYVAYLNWPEAE